MRADLHLAEGDLTPRRSGAVPGHQVVGEVVDAGDDADRFGIGGRLDVRTTAVPFDDVADALTGLAEGRTSGSLVMLSG